MGGRLATLGSACAGCRVVVSDSSASGPRASGKDQVGPTEGKRSAMVPAMDSAAQAPSGSGFQYLCGFSIEAFLAAARGLGIAMLLSVVITGLGCARLQSFRREDRPVLGAASRP